MRRFRPIAPALFLLATACVARAQEAELAIDLRAVGDSAFIGGNALFGQPPKGWIERRLESFIRMRSPDVNFLNLEATVTRSCRKFATKPFAFANAPAALAAFVRSGFNLVSLANNHTLDCLEPTATSEVKPALAEALKDLGPVGVHGLAPRYDDLVATPAILTVRGLKIGMVSMKAWDNGRKAAIGNLGNRVDLFKALQGAAVDVRILSLHGGVENTRRPTETMMDVAREFVGRYDGDVVFAHHPHKMHGFEIVAKSGGRRAVIFYSLGNFLHNGLSAKGDGMMARVAVTKSGGVDADSVAAYPLANSSTSPGPVAKTSLRSMLTMFRDSNAAIALKALPAGLKRVPFTLSEIDDVAPGFRAVPTGGAK